MAYNKINYYKKIVEIQELTYQLHETQDMFYKQIYWKHIYPKYHISYRTYHKYLGVPAKRELKKLTGQGQKTLLNLFSKCSHQNTITRVVNSIINCETTAKFCLDCGLKLTENNTECL